MQPNSQLKDNGNVWNLFTRKDASKFLWQKEFGELHPSRIVVRDWIKETYKNHKKVRPTLLDIPCGSGVDFKVLQGLVQYYGADRTTHLVDSVANNFPEVTKDHLFEADIREIPKEDKSFDIILARAIFEHLPDIQDTEKAIKECFRVAKKHLILSFFVPLQDKEKIDWNGQYFNNTYKKADIEEIIEHLGTKSVQHQFVEVDGKSFIDSYDIYFIEI